ncbi:MAG: hypothetical protein J2P16_00065 [Mycobacterium sp.]|nr:hypothetical protein [Mycobacterium sp.]
MALPSQADASIGQLVATWQTAEIQVRNRLADWAAKYPAGAASAANLTQALGVIEQHIDAATGVTKQFYEEQLPNIYMAGAADAVSVGLNFDPTMVTTETVERLASTGWDDLLKATTHVESATKRALRSIVRNEVGMSVLAGEPGATASRAGERAARDAEQIMTVTYANGATHSVADYIDTATRTTTIGVFNAGGFDLARANDVEWMEVFDSADCGWDGHDDDDLADGTIRHIDDCEEHDSSHPRCVRSFAPRPDITNTREAADAAVYTPDEQQARAAAERVRAAEATTPVVGRTLTVPAQEARAAGRQPREPRSGGRVARTPRR